MSSSFTPVDPDFYEIISLQKKQGEMVVHYFDESENIETARGKMENLVVDQNHGEFLQFATGRKVRIDRIITINGRPGPAYEEYDAYSLQCHECMGGID